jgi:ankyrin repeat protein
MPSPEAIREFVLAGHGQFEKVQSLLAQDPSLLNAAHPWGENDTETAIQAAAHVGNRAIAEYLLERGALLEICTAASLGRSDALEQMLQENPSQIKATGAHRIPLLSHAAFSGDARLVQRLYERGAHQGASMALSFAIMKGHLEVARWLLEHANPDLGFKNYQGKSLLEQAEDSGNGAMIELLRMAGSG